MTFSPRLQMAPLRRAAGIPVALVLAVLAFGPAPARAQSAETHFHAAASQFIGGDNAAALAAVNEGLRLAPGDPRLQRLKEEIEKKQQGQNQQNQQDGNGGDQQEQQGQNQQQENDQQAQNRPPEQQDPGDAERDAQNRDEQGDQQRPGDASEEEMGEEPRDAPPQPDPSRLSRAEAERILQALGNEEETLLRRVARPQTRARRVEKDW